jgi:hypothetical protein
MSLASRASNSASILIRRNTRKRPVISAPSAFRRVESAPGKPRNFRPLELSIYMPGNSLSDLPDFGGFEVNNTSGLPSAPARALSSPYGSWTAHRHQSAPYQVARKPVGSRMSRGSLATIEGGADSVHSIAKSNPLIPHFSVFISDPLSVIRRLSNHLRSKNESIPTDSTSPISRLSSPVDEALSIASTQETVRPSLFPSRIPSLKIIDAISEYTPLSLLADPPYNIHGRSISSSASSITTSRTYGHRSLPSLSSSMTATTTMQMSFSDTDHLYKEVGSVPLNRDFIEKFHLKPITTAFPRVYRDEESIDQSTGKRYEYDERFPDSNVGLAF